MKVTAIIRERTGESLLVRIEHYDGMVWFYVPDEKMAGSFRLEGWTPHSGSELASEVTRRWEDMAFHMEREPEAGQFARARAA